MSGKHLHLIIIFLHYKKHINIFFTITKIDLLYNFILEHIIYKFINISYKY